VQPGWKWLAIRALGHTLASDGWAGTHTIDKGRYRTARVKPTKMDPDLPLRQKTFINALREAGSVDIFEFGNFVEKVKTRPLATRNRKGKPIIVTSSPPAETRKVLPVGIVNPGRGYTAGALAPDPAADVSRQWDRQDRLAATALAELPGRRRSLE
jgi:hypothetical protein